MSLTYHEWEKPTLKCVITEGFVYSTRRSMLELFRERRQAAKKIIKRDGLETGHTYVVTRGVTLDFHFHEGFESVEWELSYPLKALKAVIAEMMFSGGSELGMVVMSESYNAAEGRGAVEALNFYPSDEVVELVIWENPQEIQ